MIFEVSHRDYFVESLAFEQGYGLGMAILSPKSKAIWLSAKILIKIRNLSTDIASYFNLDIL